jgi:uncharacterized protein (UPF0335 family)
MQTVVAGAEGRVDGQKVRHFTDRLKNLQEEMANVKGSIAAVLDEAATAGLDAKVLKEVIKRSRRDSTVQQAFDMAVWDYEAAIRDQPAGAPVGEEVQIENIPMPSSAETRQQQAEAAPPAEPPKRRRGRPPKTRDAAPAGEPAPPAAPEQPAEATPPLANGHDAAASGFEDAGPGELAQESDGASPPVVDHSGHRRKEYGNGTEWCLDCHVAVPAPGAEPAAAGTSDDDMVF